MNTFFLILFCLEDLCIHERGRNDTTIVSLNNINYLNDPEIRAFVFYFMNAKSRAISLAKLIAI